MRIINQGMSLQTIADTRLAELMKEGIVTGLGFGRKGDREIVLVAINHQADRSNRPEMNEIRSRVREALLDIPFEILGDYDTTSSSNGSPNDTLMPNVASLKAATQDNLPLAAQNVDISGTMGTSAKYYTPLPGGDPTSVGSPNDDLEELSGHPNDPKTTTQRLSKTLTGMLLLAAASGWGAFAYSMSSATEQERAHVAEISRVVADRAKLNAGLNQMRAEAERNRLTLERTQADLVNARAQLQESPPQTTRAEISRVVADRDKLNAELNQMREEAERNRLALERAQADLVSARAQLQESPPQASSPQIAAPPSVRASPTRRRAQ